MTERKAEVRIQFPGGDEKKLDHLYKATHELYLAGVKFDTGFDAINNVRDWEFDWSLEGAEVIFVRFADKEEGDEEERPPEIQAEDSLAEHADCIPEMLQRGYWVNNKYIHHPDLEHPCEKLNYCPYGQLVELYPLRQWEKQAKKDAKAEGKKLATYLKEHPEITARDCSTFGHECPVHYHAEMGEDITTAFGMTAVGGDKNGQ